MTEDINELIDLNLKLICECKLQFFISDLKNLKGKRIGMKIDCELFADEMVERGLIKRTNELCTVKELGWEVSKKGGWLKYLSMLKEAEKIADIEQKKIKQLEHEIKLLQKDDLEHRAKIRSQEDRIRDLTEQLQISNLIKSYWWFIGTCIGIGISFRELLVELIKGS